MYGILNNDEQKENSSYFNGFSLLTDTQKEKDDQIDNLFYTIIPSG